MVPCGALKQSGGNFDATTTHKKPCCNDPIETIWAFRQVTAEHDLLLDVHTNVRIASGGVQQSFRGVQRCSRLRVRAWYRQRSRLGCFWTTFNDVVTQRSRYDGPTRATEARKGILE